MSTQVSQSKLEASILAFVDDLDSDQSVWADGARVWRGCGHDE